MHSTRARGKTRHPLERIAWGIRDQAAPAGSNHIYVYYPLAVDPERRDDLRRYLLRHGIDGKITDMSDCSQLAAFHDPEDTDQSQAATREAALLEICVYPVISKMQIHRIARAVGLGGIFGHREDWNAQPPSRSRTTAILRHG